MTYLTTSYAEQRYERLLESVEEYLSDSEVGSSKFLDDLQRALLQLRQHHDSVIGSYTHVQDFFK